MPPSRAPEPHPEVEPLLELLDSPDAPDLHELPVEEARELLEGMFAAEGDPIAVESVEDRTIDGPGGDLPVRIYQPAGETPRPTILFFHGGGFVLGSVDAYDKTCRKLAAETGYTVASLEYRLAPEHPFPAALEDCYAALEWAADEIETLGGDRGRIVLAGDSAGGNLAAATALRSRDRGGPEIAHQVLFYPITGDVTETEAYEENGEGYFLERDGMAWFEDCYFDREVDKGNVYARPRLAADLSRLPPATVVTAGFDPLRDDGAAYAERLEAAGVPVSHHHYEDMIHGFVSMVEGSVDLTRAHEAYDAVADDLEAALE
ncbi:alpha/beta hydrolase [Haloterrigena alkaliphila]|uniref:Alpha/beta hydrolase n=1 Tax=Haloterrigena alkaliphila TaxID=2816475 RepID=A0A8A2VNT7_9EURY|nr:alpha/beta hydrolase [Haloterrigena alkaliphila]QSW99778.1 alpha/beta hydrolase [Haloterrigena alkaliphila]